MTQKINKYNVEPIRDACGLIRELYKSSALSISTVEVIGKARKHKHEKMEEIYYVEDGNGSVVIEEEVIDLKQGDLISIPKHKWHYLQGNLEVIVINSPPYDVSDVIYAEE